MTEIQSNDEAIDAEDVVDERTRTVELPERIVDRVERRVERTDFASPATYIAFVVEETLGRVGGTDEGDDSDDDVSERQVRSRLESLGYLE